jgi:hypothetical protein
MTGGIRYAIVGLDLLRRAILEGTAMKRKSFLYPLFGLIVLLLASLACGSDNSGVKVDEKEASATKPPPALEMFAVGDVIEVGDHTIVLNSTSTSGDTLEANFTIENTGDDVLAVSSLISFSARDDEGGKLDQEIFDCDSLIDGFVLVGDKLKGNICWSGLTTETAKLYYESDFPSTLFGSGDVVWEVQK